MAARGARKGARRLVAVCLRCGAARRWFEEFEAEVPDECLQCGGELLRRCKSCGAGFSSIAAVDCEECGEPLRPDELFGSKIRPLEDEEARRGRPRRETTARRGRSGIWEKRITVTTSSA